MTTMTTGAEVLTDLAGIYAHTDPDIVLDGPLTDYQRARLAEIRENRRMWVEALRSGNFAQTKGELIVTADRYARHIRDSLRGAAELEADDALEQLRSINPPGHCCLGVACEVVDGPVEWHGLSLLPADRQETLGLAGGSGWTTVQVDVDGERINLSTLNDHYDFSFSEIADLIEEGSVPIYIDGELVALR